MTQWGLSSPSSAANWFAICLKRAFAKGLKKMVLMFSYPSDGVGNHLVSLDQLDEKASTPGTTSSPKGTTAACSAKTSTLHRRRLCGLLQTLVEEMGCEVQILFANDCRAILPLRQKSDPLRHPLPRPHQTPAPGSRRRADLGLG